MKMLILFMEKHMLKLKLFPYSCVSVTEDASDFSKMVHKVLLDVIIDDLNLNGMIIRAKELNGSPNINII